MAQLQQLDDGTEAHAQHLFQELYEEGLTYKGYGEEELRALLDKDCGSVLAERR